MDIWEEMYIKAKEEYHPENVSPFIQAHHVVGLYRVKVEKYSQDFALKAQVA